MMAPTYSHPRNIAGRTLLLCAICPESSTVGDNIGGKDTEKGGGTALAICPSNISLHFMLSFHLYTSLSSSAQHSQIFLLSSFTHIKINAMCSMSM